MTGIRWECGACLCQFKQSATSALCGVPFACPRCGSSAVHTPPLKGYVNHINNDPTDNALDNLAISTTLDAITNALDTSTPDTSSTDYSTPDTSTSGDFDFGGGGGFDGGGAGRDW